MGGGLNPPQRPLCVLERLEREKMKVGGGKWMGRGKRSCFSLLPSPTMCLLFLNYCHFLLEYLGCASVEVRGDGIMLFVGEIVSYG